MCCKVNVWPLDKGLAHTILTVGLFKIQHDGTYYRQIEEGGIVYANLDPRLTNEDIHLQLSISPVINFYTDHFTKRVAASVMFEIACKYAEKINGHIEQHSNVIGCIENSLRVRLLANYPEQPFSFSKLCPGFQDVFMETK